MNEQPVFKRMGLQIGEEFPVSVKWALSGLYLPSGLNLKEEDIKYICWALKEIQNKGRDFNG